MQSTEFIQYDLVRFSFREKRHYVRRKARQKQYFTVPHNRHRWTGRVDQDDREKVDQGTRQKSWA